ncbi:hypothetical protein SPI_07866 [Niveomyces insectorum RCEF 264]|uniref:Coagulation factor 5 8 type domain containing protein n=1 Tax=Niveomyces insectorum RCEF 264 TaxID=1081102 RepID=A0A162IF67_9HYPO|nr:hypothetical protein SPI_07866 [Niveomyces insectorum RCEF 264]
MKRFVWIFSQFLLALFLRHAHCEEVTTKEENASSGIRAIFLFKDVLKSNTTALLTSGFNSFIIFGVGILADGGIMYYSNTPGSKDTLIATNGSYVGSAALADKVRSFKSADAGGSSSNRVEISMNAQHVRDLMRSPGAGTDTPIYRNFVALREAWGLDAVNDDDESIYDASSKAAFAKMLGTAGYHYTVAPYTNGNFWVNLKTKLEGSSSSSSSSNGTSQAPLLDRVYLQCYDGGAENKPGSWQSALGMKVVPLVWVTNDSKPSQGTTAAQAESRFRAWNSASTLAGAGYWNDFDIEKNRLSYKAYGDVLTTLFP